MRSCGDGQGHTVIHVTLCCVDDRLQARDSSAVDIDVQHSPPGFVNEAYHYSVTVTNNEPTHITNVRYVVVKYF